MPLVFNDGSLVPESLLAQTFEELRERFGTASWETQVLKGTWEHEGAVYEDNLTRFFVDVPDQSEHREFFKEFKVRLKHRFNQSKTLFATWVLSRPRRLKKASDGSWSGTNLLITAIEQALAKNLPFGPAFRAQPLHRTPARPIASLKEPG